MRKKHAVRAPGASAKAFRIANGLEPLRKPVDGGVVEEVCKHMTAGLSRTASAGRAGVTLATLKHWEEDYPAVYDAIGQAKLRRLANLEERLLKADAKMPQVVSAIFALKNADPEEWQENPGKGTVAPGLQQNITIVTGVPEAPAKQTLEHEPTPALEDLTDVTPAEQQPD